MPLPTMDCDKTMKFALSQAEIYEFQDFVPIYAQFKFRL